VSVPDRLSVVSHPPAGEGVIGTAARRGRRLRGAPLVPIVILGTVVIAGVGAGVLAPHDPTLGDLAFYFKPPVWVADSNTQFLLGTDQLGRDVLSRIIYGARVSLVVVALSIAAGGGLGTLLGLIAGHFGGWVDEIVMRLVDVQLALPTILVTLVLVVVFGSSFELLILIIGFWLWPTYARLVRGEVRRIRRMDYIALAQVAGASAARVMFVHELPGVVNTLIVVATLQAGWVILLEGSLSFLGVGVPPPTPTWGSMIAEGRNFIATNWWVSLFPGVVMLLTVLSLNLLGDWLRDVLDPKRVVV
jgi:peptide/nickel transport system permease protein